MLHCSQERLAKELAPYLKEVGGYAKATDKTLDLLFDEACQESLRINCLDHADGFTRKAYYQQVSREDGLRMSQNQWIDSMPRTLWLADASCTDLALMS